MSGALTIAAEHIAWCRANGVSTIDIARTVGGAEPGKPVTWNDAMWLVAAAWDRLGIRHREAA